MTALEGGNFPYNMYLERMVSLVGKRWFRPQISRELTTQIYFVIERDGRIHDAVVKIPSGNGTFELQVVAQDLDSFSRFALTSLMNLPNVKDIHTSFSLGEVKANSPLPLGHLGHRPGTVISATTPKAARAV